MHTRELKQDEWVAFLDAFSRHYRGRPVTVRVTEPADQAASQVLARRLPMVGLSAEPRSGKANEIELILHDDDAGGHLTHVICNPCRLRVSQVTDGADELLLIDTECGPTTCVDFSPAGLPDASELALPSGHTL